MICGKRGIWEEEGSPARVDAVEEPLKAEVRVVALPVVAEVLHVLRIIIPMRIGK
jgi:hypothetical protein